jgi:dipeptidyl aminopeptidase/acylaminoacyl peptidase
MKTPRSLLLAALGLAPLTLAASDYDELKRLEPVPATEPIPIVDFARPALLRDVQINHSGTQVGAIVPDHEDHLNLLLYDLATRKSEGVAAPPGDTDVSSFLWLDGERLAYVISFRKMTGQGLFFTEAGKLANAERVRPQGPAASWSILGNTPEDRNQILVNLRGPRLRYDHPELIDARNRGTLLVRYPELKTDHGFNIRFLPDKQGRLAFGITQEDGVRSLSRLSGDTWVKGPEDLDEIQVIDSGDNPGEVVVLGKRDGSGPRPLEFMDSDSGRPGEVILQEPGYDFSGWLFRDPKTLNIVGANYDLAAPHAVWFSEAYRNLQKAVDKLFPDQVVRILGMDDAGRRLLIGYGSDRQPEVFSWVDLEKHTCSLIKNSAPWIDPGRMQPTGILKFTTAEGRQMDAYLTLPAGATKQTPPPLVVIPPTASWGRWTWGFDAEVQFLASRGYAVLQPNHRGSSGYTWMYPESEDWDFRAMSDDVARATRRVEELGLVNPARVAIMGRQFGGYLAVSGVTFEPGLYKCALAVSAFVDWGDYISQDKYRQFSDATYSRFLYKLGDPARNADRYRAMSPLPNAAAIHAPVFLAWGEFDNPEMISEDQRLASALQRQGVQVETDSFINEASVIRHLDHRVELYQRIEAFLAKNL